MRSEIDFYGAGDDRVVVRSRMGIAVYTNTNGDIVIRQDGDEDCFIYVAPGDVAALIAAIEAEASDA
jgi:hypothetical protein